MDRLKLFIPLIVFIILGIIFYSMLSKDYNPQDLPSALVNKKVPVFSLENLHTGQVVTEKDLPKQAYLMNIWATWCISCRVEHPFLNKLKAQGINIVGVDYKDDKAKALKWLKDLHDPYTMVIFDESGRLGLDLGVYGAPETFLVDAEGVIRYKHVGVVDEKVWQQDLAPLYYKLNGELNNAMNGASK